MATMPGEFMTRHRLTVNDYHQIAEHSPPEPVFTKASV